jgi:hypothetical protein
LGSVNGRGRNSEKNEELVSKKASDPSSSVGFVNLTSQGINQTRRQGCDLKSVALYCLCSEYLIQDSGGLLLRVGPRASDHSPVKTVGC